MRTDKRFVTCDRCGRTQEQTTFEFLTLGRVTRAIDGWGAEGGNDLCPECFERYKELFDDFMASAVKGSVEIVVQVDLRRDEGKEPDHEQAKSDDREV